MSLKPGIGAVWFQKYYTDVYPSDSVIVRGRPCKPPRYYDKLYFEHTKVCFPNWVVLSNGDPVTFEVIEASAPMEAVKFERELRAQKFSCDSTPDRLLVREQVVLAGLSRLKRKLL